MLFSDYLASNYISRLKIFFFRERELHLIYNAVYTYAHTTNYIYVIANLILRQTIKIIPFQSLIIITF